MPDYTELRELRIVAFTARMTLLVIMIASIFHIALISYSDFWGPDHDSGFFGGNWDAYSFCSICHGGLVEQGGNPIPVESSSIFENYRCLACHLRETRAIAEDTLTSAHNVVSCTNCHDAHHEGHWRWGGRYYTSVKGLYGCYGCHKVVTQDYYPPSNPSYRFVVTHIGETTDYISFPVKKTIFRPTGYTPNKGYGVYPATFIDPVTGDFSDIPRDNRYWICLRCHFVQIGNPTTTTTTATEAHPDKCYYCHSITNRDPHDITKNNEFFITTACSFCHNNLAQAVSSSIHSSIGCRCHTVTHISRYNGSAAWAFAFLPPPGDYVTPTLPQDFNTWLNPFYYYGLTNATALGMNVYPIDIGTGTPYYLNMSYILRNGDASLGVGSGRFMTCFNCHYVTDIAAGVIAGDLFNWYIASPNVDPHSIKIPETAITNTNSNTQAYPTRTPETINIATTAMILGFTLIIYIIILVAKPERGGQ